MGGCFAYIASQLAKTRGQNHVFDNQQITPQKHNSLFFGSPWRGGIKTKVGH